MEISQALTTDQSWWNKFIEQHSPPIGSFMLTWEWGNFQQALGRVIERYVVKQGKETVAIFTLIHSSIPFGQSYGYLPRGPVIASGQQVAEVLTTIRDWSRQTYPHFLFLRLEPSIEQLPADFKLAGFSLPAYYVQPRHNLSLPLQESTEELLTRLHPSTRSNLHRAERRGVTTILKPSMSETDYEQFFAMIADTIERNHGVNAYPSKEYLRSLLGSIKSITTSASKEELRLGIFFGYQHEEPAAVYIVVYFGQTATYLYGASYSKMLGSKVTTYLHWTMLQDAKERGYHFYDLGAVDAARWPNITSFKHQFGGTLHHYIGNIDIPIKPLLYSCYNLIRRIRTRLH